MKRRDERRDVERETGFEPATACLEGRNSTPELLPRIYLCQARPVEHHSPASPYTIPQPRKGLAKLRKNWQMIAGIGAVHLSAARANRAGRQPSGQR